MEHNVNRIAIIIIILDELYEDKNALQESEKKTVVNKICTYH